MANEKSYLNPGKGDNLNNLCDKLCEKIVDYIEKIFNFSTEEEFINDLKKYFFKNPEFVHLCESLDFEKYSRLFLDESEGSSEEKVILKKLGPKEILKKLVDAYLLEHPDLLLKCIKKVDGKNIKFVPSGYVNANVIKDYDFVGVGELEGYKFFGNVDEGKVVEVIVSLVGKGIQIENIALYELYEVFYLHKINEGSYSNRVFYSNKVKIGKKFGIWLKVT